MTSIAACAAMPQKAEKGGPAGGRNRCPAPGRRIAAPEARQRPPAAFDKADIVHHLAERLPGKGVPRIKGNR